LLIRRNPSHQPIQSKCPPRSLSYKITSFSVFSLVEVFRLDLVPNHIPPSLHAHRVEPMGAQSRRPPSIRGATRVSPPEPRFVGRTNPVEQNFEFQTKALLAPQGTGPLPCACRFPGGGSDRMRFIFVQRRFNIDLAGSRRVGFPGPHHGNLHLVRLWSSPRLL